jgi:hypothetical protein
MANFGTREMQDKQRGKEVATTGKKVSNAMDQEIIGVRTNILQDPARPVPAEEATRDELLQK